MFKRGTIPLNARRCIQRIAKATIETLEARQLLSAVAPDPIAVPLDVASPLDGSLADGTLTPSAITPAELRSAYGINSIKLDGITGDGTGQTIAIVVADDDPDLVSSTASNFDSSDLHLFDEQFGLPDPPSFTKVEQYSDGSDPAPDVGWAEEASLDVEWSHAIAPQAKIVLFEASSAGAVQLLDWGAQTAADYAGVSVVSMSFGFDEFYGETSYDSVFKTPSGHSGVTFVASTGDQGAPADYPAFSPNVVAVGGTDLNLTSSGAYSSETGYDSGGGGISAYESKPGYQSGVTQSASYRTTPDVSIDGDPDSGVDVYDSFNGGYANKWYKIAGTSLSTPAWAGLIAIADQGRANDKLAALDGATQTLPKLYSISSSDFHDITSGDNGYSAGSGYDLVTGRGSPIANVLEPDLSGVSASTPTTPTSPTTNSSTGSISGKVFTDSNGNGKFDTGEAGLSGVTVYIDTNKNGKLDSGEKSIVTGSAGTYLFSNLSAGTYEIREVVPGGEKLINPGSNLYTVAVVSGSKITGDNFANAKPTASISGYIYSDKNDDTGDSALSGIEIYIDLAKSGTYKSGDPLITTNSSGYFSFTGLMPGVYQLREVIPSGYKLTNPTAGYIDVTVDVGSIITNEDWGNLK